MEKYSRVDVEYLVAGFGLMDEYAAELSHLQETLVRQLASLPSSLQQTGEAFLRRQAERWCGIDWMLPLVLGRAWSLPWDFQQTVALASVYMVIYGHIQQRAGDDRVVPSGDVLPFGSLLFTRALRQYQQLFPPSSSFWTLLEGYQLEWVETFLWQQKRQWDQIRRYSQEDVLRLAGNHALVKIGGAAVALLAEKPRMLMPLTGVLDQVHVAVQLIDSLVNWKQDLQARRATYFLTEAAFAMGARKMAALGRLNLEAFLSISSLPGKVVRRALNHLSTARKLVRHLEAPALTPYLDDLQAAAEEILRQFEGELANALLRAEPVPVPLPL